MLIKGDDDGPLVAGESLLAAQASGRTTSWKCAAMSRVLRVLLRSGLAMTAPIPMSCSKSSSVPNTGQRSGCRLKKVPELW